MVMSLRLPPSLWGQPGKGHVRILKTAGGVELAWVMAQWVSCCVNGRVSAWWRVMVVKLMVWRVVR